MTQTVSEPIPLPDHLKNCGCPAAERGRHLTSCGPAKEHDRTPLHERPDYVEGGRFAAISWDYPLTITAEIHVTVDVDPVAYIVSHLDEYESFTLEAGFEDWEKPISFLCQQLEDGADLFGVPFGHPRHESRVDSYMDFHGGAYGWTPQDTKRVDAAIAAHKNPPPSLFDDEAVQS